MTHLKQAELEHDAKTRDDPLLKIAVEINGRLEDIDLLLESLEEEKEHIERLSIKKRINQAREDLHPLCKQWRAFKDTHGDSRYRYVPPPPAADRNRDRDMPPIGARPPIGHNAVRITPNDINPPPTKPYISNVHEKGACLAVPLMCKPCNVHTTYLYEINMHEEPHASRRGTWSPVYMFDPAYIVCSTCKREPKRD